VQDELKRYYRCYGQLVRAVPSDTDSRVIQIRSGAIDGTTACSQLLEKATLNPSSKEIKKSSSSKVETELETYKVSLHTVMRAQSCTGCHALDKIKKEIPHSDPSASVSYESIIKYVDLVTPDRSAIVARIKTSRHSCGTAANCNIVGDAILNGIVDWQKKINSYQIPNMLGYDLEGVQVLKTMNDLHRSFFNPITLANTACISATFDVYDIGSAAYYYTNALFGGQNFSEVFTGSKRYRAIRKNDFGRRNSLLFEQNDQGQKIDRIKEGHFDNNKLEDVIGTANSTVPLVDIGILTGIKEEVPYAPLSNLNFDYRFPSKIVPFQNITESFGGGVLGDPSHYLQYHGLLNQQNGSTRVPRRWSNSLFSSVLCREVPVIRASDALKYVHKDAKSPLPFRNGLSCMQCHASMDTMARTVRNRIIVESFNQDCGNAGRGVAYGTMVKTSASLGAHPEEVNNWIDNDDRDFIQRETKGKFVFRGYDGKLTEKDVSSLDEIGEIIKGLDDPYLCISKRYFKFLSGIDIPINDPGNPEAQKLTADEKKHYDWLVSVSMNFKKHQSLKKMMTEMIQSKTYIESNAGVAP
jgi:hypothetical protein